MRVTVRTTPFQSTLLVRGATISVVKKPLLHNNFNPRSSWEERLNLVCKKLARFSISIHAPRERSDPDSKNFPYKLFNFNPRSSWEERQERGWFYENLHRFQSTLLVRGATTLIIRINLLWSISIHAPRERSDCKIINLILPPTLISIHAPRERSDKGE